MLLNAYPDSVFMQNQYGNLPLHCATAYQAPAEVVQLLLEAWPDGAAMQNRNKVSVMRVTSFDSISVLQLGQAFSHVPFYSFRMRRCITPLHTQ
jgi:ankyrin repeat protein